MTELIKHKRVEFTELFYDLVFVFAISKTTALIHHLHNGILTWDSILAFLVTLLVLVNSWMIQTVFTNRYGKNSLVNIIVMFTKMALLLLLSNVITNDWQETYHYFCSVVGFLSLTLFIQYLIEYRRKECDIENQKSILNFLYLTGIRSVVAFIAAILPIQTGSILFITGIVGTFVMPIFNTRHDAAFKINLPHLIERISLLVIITFGEMVMGLADYYTPETFSMTSILLFLLMVLLFLYYFGQFDHAIDEASNSRGLFLIYSHYPIFIGLIMITVSMSFLVNPEANHLFVTAFFFTGIGLFQAAILANGPYNKDYLRYSKRYYMIQIMIFIVGTAVGLFFKNQPFLVILGATLMVFLMEFHFIQFYMRQSIKHGKINWYLI